MIIQSAKSYLNMVSKSIKIFLEMREQSSIERDLWDNGKDFIHNTLTLKDRVY